MAGGSTTTKSAPWEKQQPFLERGFARAEDLYSQNPQGTPYYQGPTLAGFDPAQEASQGAMLGYATGPRPGVMQAGSEQALMKGLGGQVDYDPYGASNPFGDMMNVAGRKVLSELQGTVLPGIREGLMFPGGISGDQHGGSSRSNLLQQKALGTATQQLTDAATDMYGGAYDAAQARIPEFLRQQGAVQQAPLMPYQAMADVGAQRRAMTQEGINRSMQRDAYTQEAPQRALQNYLASVTGDYGAVSNTTQSPGMGGILGGILPFMMG